MSLLESAAVCGAAEACLLIHYALADLVSIQSKHYCLDWGGGGGGGGWEWGVVGGVGGHRRNGPLNLVQGHWLQQ